jgi:hypothetical protein
VVDNKTQSDQKICLGSEAILVTDNSKSFSKASGELSPIFGDGLMGQAAANLA